MHNRILALTLFCVLCCCAASAQPRDERGEWRLYQPDSIVSVYFPPYVDSPKGDITNGLAVAYGPLIFAVRIYNLGDEIKEMRPMKPKALADLVYKEQIEKNRQRTRNAITVKEWYWEKQKFAMVLWHPVSPLESEYTHTIKSFPWSGYDPNAPFPPLIRSDRMLFYNNKLYIFSVLSFTPPYHNDEYYMAGGIHEAEIQEMRNRFFRSIEIKN